MELQLRAGALLLRRGFNPACMVTIHQTDGHHTDVWASPPDQEGAGVADDEEVQRVFNALDEVERIADPEARSREDGHRSALFDMLVSKIIPAVGG